MRALRTNGTPSAAPAVPTPGWAAYAAATAAAGRWARDVDAEVRPLGVTLGVVRLPLVQTAMAAPTAAYADARALSPERAADRLLRSSSRSE